LNNLVQNSKVAKLNKYLESLNMLDVLTRAEIRQYLHMLAMLASNASLQC